MRKHRYGVTEDGREVDIYHLTNDAGMRVSILTFGGIIATLEVPDRAGRLANVVLGLASLDSYARVSPHFGAVVGRFANRIRRTSLFFHQAWCAPARSFTLAQYFVFIPMRIRNKQSAHAPQTSIEGRL